MRKSADSKIESADSSWRNHAPNFSNHSNSIKKLRKKQKEFEVKEHETAEQRLDEELKALQNEEIKPENLSEFLTINFPNNAEAIVLAEKQVHEYRIMSRPLTEESLKEYLLKNLNLETKISNADGAIILKEKFIAEGKSEVEILKILLATYKSEPEFKTFVENWNKFLELWKYAQDKPPTERKAIETIISNSNFTADNSFDLVLSEIDSSADISEVSKFEIRRKFKTSGINSVRAFDQTLKNEKQYRKSIERNIQSRNTNIENLNDEISNLNVELDKLPLDDPKRSELKAKIKEKGTLLENYEHELTDLRKAKPNKVQFQLRNDLMATLNPDGSRSVRIVSENFTIQLPNNIVPLMGTKNLRSINVAFPFLALRSLHISNEIFAPDLVDKGIPIRNNRDMAHYILSSLGIDDNRILSDKDIAQLKSDLSHLIDKDSGKTGRECLIELGIYDVASQKVNEKQLKKALRSIRENRENRFDFEKLKLSLNK